MDSESAEALAISLEKAVNEAKSNALLVESAKTAAFGEYTVSTHALWVQMNEAYIHQSTGNDEVNKRNETLASTCDRDLRSVQTAKRRKAKKQLVPDEMKDERYWANRMRNNIAASRSREARRQRGEQLEARARDLMVENEALQRQLEYCKWQNYELRAQLAKLERAKYLDRSCTN